jgi:hypothetical protein
MSDTSQNHRELLKHLSEATQSLGLHSIDESLDNELSISERRRRRRQAPDDQTQIITLNEVDGVLRWQEGFVQPPAPGRRGRRGFMDLFQGEPVTEMKFTKLGSSDVGKCLKDIDQKLTPNIGLRRWDKDSGKLVLLEDNEKPVAKKRALLFIHGTFSNNDNIFDQLKMTKAGEEFLTRISDSKNYDEVLAFDHYTLSLNPVLNALDLSRRLADCKAQVDVICHSRGGLVTRWWLEVFNPNTSAQTKAVMVGSPLNGTSLADPTRLRNALDFLTNVGNVFSLAGQAASTVMPFFTVAVGLMKIFSSITSAGAKLPLIDAMIAMIPGLAAQSMTDTNFELTRLRKQGNRPLPDYHAVISNFETEEVGWKFWKMFADWKNRAKDAATNLIFDGENDLVVNTSSMTSLFDSLNLDPKDKKQVLNFETTNSIHHTNYFQQKRTIDFIAKSLDLS